MIYEPILVNVGPALICSMSGEISKVAGKIMIFTPGQAFIFNRLSA